MSLFIWQQNDPCIDYFYSLKNVSFCAFHPRDHRYLGFITKHPTLQRFACHVFRGNDSTRPVAEGVGYANKWKNFTGDDVLMCEFFVGVLSKGSTKSL